MATECFNLRSFQHCRKDVDLVCFQLPEVCPLCQQCTATTESRIPPYVLPSPFYSSTKAPRSVILRVTHGDFVRNYTRASNLHIGITDKNGMVYDFDEKGLNQSHMWTQCLPVLACISGQSHLWDQTLEHICHQASLWHKSRYRENEWNCFDFVLQFILQLGHPDVTGLNVMSKADFCDQFLTQKTKRVEQYIYLYRQAILSGCVIVPKKNSSLKDIGFSGTDPHQEQKR